mgnify:CR=1 FL=1
MKEKNINKNLVAKDIDGKKIREQYFDGLIIGLCIFAICYIIFCLFDIENFKNKLAQDMASAISVSAKITLVSPHSIERSEGKAKRITDKRFVK